MTRVTERDLLDLLHRRYSGAGNGPGPRCIVAEHVRNRASFDANRTADAIMVDTWRSSLAVHGFEVKCSRTDWLTELRNPGKASAFIPYCHFWWLVVADKSIVRDDLPDGWGLLVPHGDTLRAEVGAKKRRNPDPLPLDMIAPILRSVQKTAERRGYQEGQRNQLDTSPEVVDELRRLLTETGDQMHTYRQTAERARRDRDFYKTALAAVSPEGLPCATCGKGLRPKGYRYNEWRHRRKADEEPCRLLRVEAARADAEALWASFTPERQESLLGGWGPQTGDEWVERAVRYPNPPQPIDLEHLDDEQEGAA